MLVQHEGRITSLQDDKSDEKVEDFTSNDVFVDPHGPARTWKDMQTLYPDLNHAEGLI